MIEQENIPTIDADTHREKPKHGPQSDAWMNAFMRGFNTTIQDAVAELRISERTIRRMMNAGSIQYVKVGGRVLLSGTDVRAMRRQRYRDSKERDKARKAAAKRADQ